MQFYRPLFIISRKFDIEKGFTLLELVSVLVLIGILGASVGASLLPSDSFQLQSSRDQLVTAFFSAQQRAMVQTSSVRLETSSTNQIDVREDSDGDGSFSDESSLRLGGVQYPISLLPNQSLTSATLDFDRLGRTSATNLTLSQNGKNVIISIGSTGYVN